LERELEGDIVFVHRTSSMVVDFAVRRIIGTPRLGNTGARFGGLV
jgi:hypothetical protein